ncbi:hypothetical protein BW723_04845 [Polaribacter reichenbachii]|uniref:Legume lectin domain-containing protein n=2 Tax=Polaribacter reichenbachii TaxID=996801 RepID=A0A1B8TUY4_9FLAO|nr:hypothetical protein BW723_04845 [Polaribacter reichenbachii]AUC19527.1 hypothetical protein BTO17_12855 [Polaribacter reichenbachii]OBY63319.1 hypothetical protein LPB301_10865 [Polaribacter reichenbachii]
MILFAFKVSAQLKPNFFGNAYSSGGDCYVITDNQQTQAGSVWYDNSIDFTSDFEIIFEVNFGSNDNDGADGIALVMKDTPETEIGIVGAGLGYERIFSSIAVEFDTFENSERSDIPEDHIALISNGSTIHDAATNLAGPISALSASSNIEDGQFHEVKISWVAATQTFKVIFDCEERISYTGDLVKNVFDGESQIYFGFTGSTGLYYNLHQVCFKYLSFVKNQDLPDQEICLGDTIDTVDVTYNGAVSYQWSPSAGVSDPTLPNPIFSPTEDVIYTVEILDSCNEIISESFEVKVNKAVVESIIPVKSAICFNEDAEFTITGSPNAKITFSINNEANQTIELDNLGSASIVVNEATTDQTVTISLVEDTSGSGCSMIITESATISVGEPLNASISYILTCDGGIANINGEEGGVFTFNPMPLDEALINSNTGEITNGTIGTTYNVSYIITNGGCSKEIITTITIESCVIPEVITPNNDGLNDRFYLNGLNVEDLEIFNRYGTTVFHKTNGYTDEFNGISKDGKELPTGTYFYKIIFKNKPPKTGWVYINREQ